MLNIIQIVLPVFIVLASGYAVKKMKLIDDQFIRTSNGLIFNVCLPVLLYYKISLADLSSVFDITHVSVMYFAIFVIFALSFALKKPLKLGHSTGTFAVDSFRANFAYMGLPVSAYAFGDKGLVTGSVLMAFVVPLSNLMSVIALNMSSGAGKHLKPLIKSSLLNPLAVACIAGLLTSWAKIHFPVYIDRSLMIISGITLPLALISVGGTISVEKLRGDIKNAAVSSGLKLLLMPFIAYLCFKTLGMDIDTAEKTVIIMVSAPAATVNYVLAATMDGDASLAGSSIVMSTLLSILTFTFWLFVLGV